MTRAHTSVLYAWNLLGEAIEVFSLMWRTKTKEKILFSYDSQPTDKALRRAEWLFLQELTCLNVDTLPRAKGNLCVTLAPLRDPVNSPSTHKNPFGTFLYLYSPSHMVAITLQAYGPLIYIWRVSWLIFSWIVGNNFFLTAASPSRSWKPRFQIP